MAPLEAGSHLASSQAGEQAGTPIAAFDGALETTDELNYDEPVRKGGGFRASRDLLCSSYSKTSPTQSTRDGRLHKIVSP